MPIPPEQEPITYASLVNYNAMDPLKRDAQKAAATTSKNIERRGFFSVDASRGESAFVVDEGDRYSAHTIEGLGTKSLVASAIRKERIANQIAIATQTQNFTGRTHFDTLSIDTLAMMFNDIITVGADPLVVNAYWSTGSSEWFKDSQRKTDLVNGWAHGCDLAGATWGGGETPVSEGITFPEEIDLAGSVYGIIKPKTRLTLGEKLVQGDSILLIESSGIGANGLSTGRHTAARIAKASEGSLADAYATQLSDGQSYGEALLTPTHIYAKLVQELFDADIDIHYMSNITGHGWRKLMRSTKQFTYDIERIPTPHPVFEFIEKESGNEGDKREMYGTFNMGAGFAIFLPQEMVQRAQEVAFNNHGFDSINAGTVKEGPRQVIIRPLNDLRFGEETLGVR